MAQIVKELVTKWSYKVDARQVKAAVKQVQGLKKQMAEVKKSSSQFATAEVRKVNRVKTAWANLQRQVRGYRTEVSRSSRGGPGGGMGGGFKTFAAARALGVGAGPAAGLAGGAGIAGLTGIGAALRAGGGAEVARVELEGFLKSGEKTVEFMQNLAKFGSTTPFEIPQLENLSTQLLAGGFAADELIPTLRRLGNVTGGSSDKLNRMLINLIQIRNNNRAYTMDLKQFAMAGIPIFGQLQKQLGKSGDEIRQMAQDGEITFDVINKALIEMTSNGGMFEGRMTKISKTLFGRISNLKDAFFLLGRTMTEDVIPILSDFVHSLSFSVQGIADGITWLKQFGTELKIIGAIGALVAIKFFPLTATIGALFLLVEDFIGFMQGRDSVIGRIGQAFGAIFETAGIYADRFLQKILGIFSSIKGAMPSGLMEMLSMGGETVSFLGNLMTGQSAAAGENLQNLLGRGDQHVTINQNNNVGLRGGESAAGAQNMINGISTGAMRSANRQLKPAMGN